MKNPNQSFGEKIKEILIEIGIIVFAVTLSIWLHSWNEHRHEQVEVKKFLVGLKEDLTKDIELLQNNKSRILNLDSNYAFLLVIAKKESTDKELDSQIHKRLYYSLLHSHINIGRYEGFKSSGKIETIENDDLKEAILAFYQQTIIHVTDQEEIVNSFQLKILDLDLDKNGKMPILDFVRGEKIQGLFFMGSQNIKTNTVYYDDAIKQAREIIVEIDKETVN